MIELPQPEAILSADIEAPILGSRCVDTDDFEKAFRDASAEAEASGNRDQAAVYRLLADICTFHFRPAEKIEPFSNRMGFGDGRRTLVGSDLASDTIAALGQTVSRLSNTALRTRIADLVWSQDKRQAACARIAINGYLDLVEKLIDGTGVERFHEADPTGISAQEFLQRAGVIARTLGWAKPENERFRQCFVRVLELGRVDKRLQP